MKGQKAFGEVTHTLMRMRYPYRPGHPMGHMRTVSYRYVDVHSTDV